VLLGAWNGEEVCLEVPAGSGISVSQTTAKTTGYYSIYNSSDPFGVLVNRACNGG